MLQFQLKDTKNRVIWKCLGEVYNYSGVKETRKSCYVSLNSLVICLFQIPALAFSSEILVVLLDNSPSVLVSVTTPWKKHIQTAKAIIIWNNIKIFWIPSTVSFWTLTSYREAILKKIKLPRLSVRSRLQENMGNGVENSRRSLTGTVFFRAIWLEQSLIISWKAY